jgi:hypothetical protein
MKSFVGKNIPKGKFNYEKIPNFDEALEKIEI